MNIKNFLALAVFVAVIGVLSTFNVSAQEMMKKPETEKPIVAIIKADWCPYCKRIEPVISNLINEYGEKLTFIEFDVTDEAAIKASMKKAEALGLSDFFKEFKRKTSAVAVLKNKEILYKTFNNGKKEDYIKEFEKALK